MKISIFPIALTSLLFASSAMAVCADNIEQLAPNDRFQLLNNGEEVLDKNTDLVWKHCAEGLSGADCSSGAANAYTWQAAVELEDGVWRLPNIKELASLVDPACFPAYNDQIFQNTSATFFWTSSPDVMSEANAWQVDFSGGEVVTNSKAVTTQVRLVKTQ